MNDREDLANVHLRKAGVLRIIGQNDFASREALLSLRFAPGVVDIASRHHLFGENAAVALAQGYPGIALDYQNEAVLLLEAELSRTTPAPDPQQLANLRNNLATALRARAAIQVRREHFTAASEDLNEAIRLSNDPRNRSAQIVRGALLARIQEVAGQAAMKKGDPARAAAAFTAALDLLFPGEYRTFRATLHMQRADARDALREAAAAESDLRAAVDDLRAEEGRLLETQQRIDAEPLWTPYFSRFPEIYERLIRHLVERGEKEEAFHFSEEARAFEPLNLVLPRDVVPETFRRWTRKGETLPLERIQSSLAPGTFLVEFSVLPDRTYVWIVGRSYFDMIPRPVRREVIDRWSRSLQLYARQLNRRAFIATLEEVYGALLGEPLAKITKLAPANETLKLVFVPDRSLHGIPFAALRNEQSGRYLIEDHRVSIAASATFYVFSLERDKELAAAPPSTVLLIGDPAFDRSLEVADDLGRLPGARIEVNNLERLYGPAAIKLHDAGATVPEFMRLTQQSTIVHFAGHAIANPEAPFRSLLLLAPSGQDHGVLLAEDLVARLHAGKTRLFVLSACSSAGGVPIGPEGLAPLVRPLMAAGVPAVVGSLWKVDDRPAAELLTAFHRNFRSGHDADDALRLAQLELLHKTHSAYGSVLAWAPFQLVGHASSPYR